MGPFKKHWSEKYLKLPRHSHNCAEFVELVLREHFKKDIRLPQSEGSFFIESKQIKENLDSYVKRRKLGEFEEGDMVLMSGTRRLCHIGILMVMANKLYVLHSLKSSGFVSRVRLNRLSEQGLKVEGFYQWLK